MNENAPMTQGRGRDSNIFTFEVFFIEI